MKKISPVKIGTKTKVANVGYIHGVHEDVWMFQKVFDWLNENEPFLKIPPVENHANFDLNTNPPTDFLLDNKKYNIVILHMIYHCTNLNEKIKFHDYYNQSELHNINNWKNRLIKTNAQYIFTFGCKDEISGKTIGELIDYCKIEIDCMFTVYKNKKILSYLKKLF